MELKIIGPTSSYLYSATWFEVTTDNGSFIVQKGHIPMIVTLKENSPFSIGMSDGTTKNIPIKSGILKIDRTSATLLITQE